VVLLTTSFHCVSGDESASKTAADAMVIGLSGVVRRRLTTLGGGNDNCVDLDNGAADPYGDECEHYASNPHWCGLYDGAIFSSSEMCCGCGGGYDAGSPTPGPTHTTTPTVTPKPTSEHSCPGSCFGVTCDQWYIDDGSSCAVMENAWGCDCTGCDCANDDCVDLDDGSTDPYGNGCEDYTYHPGWCGNRDNTWFSSENMCCSCGGGSISRNITANSFPQFSDAIESMATGGSLVVKVNTSSMTFTDQVNVKASLLVRILGASTERRPVLSGGGATRLFYVRSGSELSLEDIEVIEGYAHNNAGYDDGERIGGAFVVFEATLTLINCIVRNCYSRDYVSLDTTTRMEIEFSHSNQQALLLLHVIGWSHVYDVFCRRVPDDRVR